MEKRRIAMIAAGTIVAVCLVAPQGIAGSSGMPKNVKARYASGGYNYVSGSSSSGADYNLAEPVEFEVKAQERWATLAIDDRTGRSTPAQVGQDVDGDGALDETWDVCGATSEPLELTPGTPLIVNVAPGPCGAGVEPSTSGSIFVQLYSPGREGLGGPSGRVERSEKVPYTGNYFGDATTGSFSIGAFSVQTLPWERFVTVSAKDATGMPVLVTLYPQNGPAIAVCTSSTDAVEIPPGDELAMTVDAGACDQAPALPTTGTLEITLSNRP